MHESIGLPTLVAIMVLALILFGPRRSSPRGPRGWS
jgi:Sec-independent protein translocase protein TatA